MGSASIGKTKPPSDDASRNRLGGDLQTIGAFMRPAEDGRATDSKKAADAIVRSLQLSPMSALGRLGAGQRSGGGETQGQQHGGGDTVEHQFEADEFVHHTHLQVD